MGLPAARGGKVAAAFGEEANDRVLATGDLRHRAGAAYVCQMFRARGFTNLVAASGGRTVAMSASNWASLGDPGVLADLEADPDRWSRFLDHEVAAGAEPGAAGGGTHTLSAAEHA